MQPWQERCRCSCCPESCAADTVGDFQQLSQQFTRQFDAGEYTQAEQTALKLRGLAEGPLRGAQPVALGRALGMQARVVARQARYVDAERLYQQAIAQLDNSGERGQSDLGIVLNGLGDLYRQLARYGEAEPAYRRRRRSGRSNWARRTRTWPRSSTTSQR